MNYLLFNKNHVPPPNILEAFSGLKAFCPNEAKHKQQGVGYNLNKINK